jgi:hypothetical protein
MVDSESEEIYYKITPVYNKSISEISEWRRDGESFQIITTWRYGYAKVEGEIEYPEDYEKTKRINVLALNLIDHSFDDGDVEFIFISDFSDDEQEEIENAYTESYDDGLEELGFEEFETEY